MGQEWDFPPNRKWKPEITLLPGAKPEYRRFDRTIDHQKARHKTGWAWYKAQMQAGGSSLYKLNLTALYFTLCGFILAVVAIVAVIFGLLISNAAKAQDAPPIEANSQIMPDFPLQLLAASVPLIEAHGWHCDSISAARTWVLSRGFTVICNQYSYQYDIEDRGGNWEVTLK